MNGITCDIPKLMPLFTEAAGRNRWSVCYLGKRRCDSSQAAGKQEMIVHSLVTTTGHFMGLVKFGTGILVNIGTYLKLKHVFRTLDPQKNPQCQKQKTYVPYRHWQHIGRISWYSPLTTPHPWCGPYGKCPLPMLSTGSLW